jgi:hypothetical protein
MNDEYIDYSCSTPIERLSRDIETLLRSWFIIDGSDRHVGFRDGPQQNGKPSSKVQTSNPWAVKTQHLPPLNKKKSNKYTPVKEYNRFRLLSPPRSATRLLLSKDQHDDPLDHEYVKKNFHESLNDSTSSALLFHTPPRTRKDLYILEDARCNHGVQLIRSGKINYVTTSPNNDRVEIELDLCLWDGPPPTPTSTTNVEDRNPKHFTPISLLTNAHDIFPKTNILSNLSSIFGIGQHLTLSPTCSNVADSILQQTILVLEHANHPGRKKKMSSFMAAMSSTRQTLEGIVSLHTAALRVLSNQLQTAMNIAVVNCDCRIPSFGIWGIYQPDTVKRSSDGNIEETLMQSVMEVPMWMNGGDLFNVASEESVCCLFRKQIECMRKGQDESNHVNGDDIDIHSDASFSEAAEEDDNDDSDDVYDDNASHDSHHRQVIQHRKVNHENSLNCSRTSLDFPPTSRRRINNRKSDEQYLTSIV